MSLGALSLALLLGGVNAACGPARARRTAPVAVAPEPAIGSGAGTGGAPAQVWRAKAGRRFTGRMVVSGETIYGGGVDRKVYAVDLSSGQTQWSSRLGGLIGGGVLVAGDTVYAASSRPEGKVYALDARTGRRHWRTSTGPVSAPLALIGGVIVAETQRGQVVGLERNGGAVKWRRKLGVSRIPAVAADSGTIVIATVDSLFRVSAKDGKVIRRARSPGAIVSPWIEHGGALVAGTTDSLVVAIDPADLHTRWRATLDAPVLGSPAAAGDTLYAASRRGTLYRVTVDSAAAATATPIAELDWPITAPVTVLDNLVLLGGADGILRALRPDGSEAWRLQLRWPVELGPLPLADGILAVGGDGDLHRYRR
jgi:outer membrane protein assembly factor BamB